MRNWFYIAFCLMILACSKQENNMESSSVETSDVVLEPAADEVMIEEEAVAAEEYTEATPVANQSNKEILTQQLQETLNLIVLNNKVDLSDDLKTELKATIHQKVADYTLDLSYDVLDIKHLDIIEQSKRQNLTRVDFLFDASSPNQPQIQGHGTARIQVNAVNIDNEVYQEYQIYFEEIVVE